MFLFLFLPLLSFVAGVGDVQFVRCQLGFAVGAMVGACFKSPVLSLCLLLSVKIHSAFLDFLVCLRMFSSIGLLGF